MLRIVLGIAFGLVAASVCYASHCGRHSDDTRGRRGGLRHEHAAKRATKNDVARSGAKDA